MSSNWGSLAVKLAEEKKAVKKKRKLLEGSAAGGEKGHVQVPPPGLISHSVSIRWFEKVTPPTNPPTCSFDQ